MIGIRPNWLLVGERNWFNLPADRFFRFFTQSGQPLVIYMPIDEPEAYEKSNFLAIQQIIAKGGYSTWDLG